MALDQLLAILPQLLVSGLMIGAIYALVALGFYIVYAGTGVINFAQGDFVVIGLFFMWTYAVGLDLGLYLSLPLTVASSVLVVAVFERLAISPVREREPFIPLLITLAGGILIRGVVQIIWSPRPRLVPHFSGEEPLSMVGAAILPQALWIIGGTGIVLVLVYLFFRRTFFGLSMLGTASNLEGARVIGVNTGRITLYAFAISAALSGIAGSLIVPITTASLALGMDFSLKGFAGAILGGIEKPQGAVLGGLVVGLSETLVAGLISSEYRNLLVFGMMMLVLVFRPQGLFGAKDTSR